MTDNDYTAIVFGCLRSLGEPGDEVMTAIRPWLERLNTRSRYVRILA